MFYLVSYPWRYTFPLTNPPPALWVTKQHTSTTRSEYLRPLALLPWTRLSTTWPPMPSRQKQTSRSMDNKPRSTTCPCQHYATCTIEIFRTWISRAEQLDNHLAYHAWKTLMSISAKTQLWLLTPLTSGNKDRLLKDRPLGILLLHLVELHWLKWTFMNLGFDSVGILSMLNPDFALWHVLSWTQSSEDKSVMHAAFAIYLLIPKLELPCIILPNSLLTTAFVPLLL